MRLTTDTDWTMVTGADCYRCFTKAYNSSLSTTVKNGTFYKPDNAFGELKGAGESKKDRACLSNQNVCVNDFEFFVINKNTDETRDVLQRTDGVIGLAPDDKDNGPSFLTSLK